MAKNPILIVPKDHKEVRPVMDCSKSGLNQALAPWGMSLPTIHEFLYFLGLGTLMGKRDFRHGFHHQIVKENDRKYLGFDVPGYEGSLVGRFVSLPFGLSLSPAHF